MLLSERTISANFVTVTGGDCAKIYIGVGISWVLASTSTAMLFFLRVRALYWDNFAVKGFFTLLWLSVVGGAVTVPVALSASGRRLVHYVPGESYCLDTGTYPGYAGLSMIMPAIYDTLVFLAISYRLFPSYTINRNVAWIERIKLFFTGHDLPGLSKALLQGGQQYYL